MLELEIFEHPLDGPPCRACGATTRVIGIEQHAVMSQITVVTGECRECGLIFATIAMPKPARHGADGAYHAR
jgi:uncharacterized Zn finger protein